jgi:hypothetical protein
MAGAAIIVSLQQLKALLGIVHFTTEMGLVPVMASVFHHTKEVIDVSCSLIVFEACSRRSSYSQLITNVRVCSSCLIGVATRSGRGRRFSWASASWCCCWRRGMWYVTPFLLIFGFPLN